MARPRGVRGIYAVVYKDTNQFWLDGTLNLEQAWIQWLKDLHTSEVRRALLPTVNPDRYAFQVLKEMPDETTRTEIKQAVERLQRLAMRMDPNKLLNPPPTNRRLYVTINGDEVSLRDLARQSGLNYSTLVERYNRGMRGEDILRRMR